MPDINSKTECLIFSTRLKDKNDVYRISGLLNLLPGIQEWSIDLEDWEKVLRIECINIPPEKIIELLHIEGITSGQFFIKKFSWFFVFKHNFTQRLAFLVLLNKKLKLLTGIQPGNEQEILTTVNYPNPHSRH